MMIGNSKSKKVENEPSSYFYCKMERYSRAPPLVQTNHVRNFRNVTLNSVFSSIKSVFVCIADECLLEAYPHHPPLLFACVSVTIFTPSVPNYIDNEFFHILPLWKFYYVKTKRSKIILFI